ncbi:MAG: helix-turn-helix domain-containing protein [Solirubrobacteraceae bacterium]
METTTRHVLPAELAAALRTARVAHGLGVCETARRAGISHGHLSMLENGTRCPSIAVARDVAEALNLAPDIAAHLFAVACPAAGRSWRADR